ncbi:MAG TPA: hypothetical protein VK508_21625 [Cyclobacteriaceae bacterium]|nr:hypothetical protein [Cyclobacteriaceae bacterium]
MSHADSTGQWFLPGSTVKMPGELLVNEAKGSIILVLYGKSYIEGLAFNPEIINDGYQHFHEVIHGKTAFSCITLLNCSYHGVRPLGLDLFEIKYSASIALHGGLLSSKSQLLIKNALLKFPYLSEWYDGTKSPFKIDDYTKSKSVTSQQLSVTETLKFIFHDIYQKRDTRFGVSYEVNFEKLLELEYAEAVSLDELFSNVLQFSKLLQFSICKSIAYNLHIYDQSRESIRSRSLCW